MEKITKIILTIGILIIIAAIVFLITLIFNSPAPPPKITLEPAIQASRDNPFTTYGDIELKVGEEENIIASIYNILSESTETEIKVNECIGTLGIKQILIINSPKITINSGQSKNFEINIKAQPQTAPGEYICQVEATNINLKKQVIVKILE